MSNSQEKIEIIPMGVIHSPYTNRQDTPKNGRLDRETISEIVVDPQFSDCLINLQNYKYLHILFWGNKSSRTVLKCDPRGTYRKETTGVFGTRSPDRPNPILTSLVELVEIKNNIIKVKMLEAYDGSILVDIKPYIDNCDDVKMIVTD